MINEHPWMALLEYENPEKYSSSRIFACGGVLINRRYVLTAAHCIRDSPYKLISVRLGEWNLDTDEDCIDEFCSDPVLDVAIDRIVPHEKYGKSKYFANDIALIRLAKNVCLTDYIRPICLPPYANRTCTNCPVDGTKLQVVGWGVTEKKLQSNIKLKADVVKVNHTDCLYQYFKEKIGIFEGQMCAIGEKGADTCKGDSGGPLILKKSFFDEERNYSREYNVLVGLTSFGAKCGDRHFPGVYTNIYYYLEWIANTMMNLNLQ